MYLKKIVLQFVKRIISFLSGAWFILQCLNVLNKFLTFYMAERAEYMSHMAYVEQYCSENHYDPDLSTSAMKYCMNSKSETNVYPLSRALEQTIDNIFICINHPCSFYLSGISDSYSFVLISSLLFLGFIIFTMRRPEIAEYSAHTIPEYIPQKIKAH